MPSIPTNAQDRTLPSPLAAGMHALLPHAPEGTQLFRDEVRRAVERQGGERALEERSDDLSSARRAGRAGGFERYRTSVEEARDQRARRGREGSEDTGQALAETPRVTEPERKSGSRTGAERGAPEREASPARHEAKDAVKSRSAESAGAPAATSGAPGAPGANGVTGATGPNPTTSADAARVSAASPRAAGPPASDGTVPFLAGARGERASARAGAAGAPAPATPDAALIDRAAEVLKQIRLSLKNGAKEVTVQLSPADLGRLSIRMRLTEGKLSTVVRVESQRTLELLERQAPELRALLAQQGFDAEQVDVGLGFGAQAWSPESGRDEYHARSGAGERDVSPAPQGAATESHDRNTMELANREGAVDTYA